MLEVGNGGMTDTEYRSHFSLWAEMAAPLIAGTDLRSASAATLAIYLNRAVIAVDQDSLGKQGTQVSTDGTRHVLTRPLSNGDRAVALFNEGSSSTTIATSASAVGMPGAASYTLTDLWSGGTTQTTGAISASVPSHGTVMYRVHASGSTVATIEAESSANTLSGGARVASCGGCSGGAKVGFVGNGGTLRINQVSVPASGSYQLTVAYCDGDSGRSGDMSVDAGSPTVLSFTNSGGWSTPAALTVTVHLNAGVNTITFSNPAGWAPDFDQVIVRTG
jgi:alpha-galactosidase